MTLREQLEHWKESPGSLGSEVELTLLVAEAVIASKKPMPKDIEHALKVLSLRATLGAIMEPHRDENNNRHFAASSQFNCLDALGVTLISGSLSWMEAMVAVFVFVNEHAGEAQPGS